MRWGAAMPSRVPRGQGLAAGGGVHPQVEAVAGAHPAARVARPRATLAAGWQLGREGVGPAFHALLMGPGGLSAASIPSRAGTAGDPVGRSWQTHLRWLVAGRLGHRFTQRPSRRGAGHTAGMRLPKRLLLTAAVGAVAARRVLRAPYDLTGRAALVTGGSRGLGLALARELLDRGANVTLMARTAADLDRARARLNAGTRVQVVVGDVTSEADLDRAVQETVRAHGALDVVVSNAGVIQVGPLADMTEADFRSILEVNALAPLRLTLAARPHLRGGGRVLIVSSVGGGWQCRIWRRTR